LTERCPECGEEVGEEDDFCGNCGADLEEGEDIDLVIGAKEVIAAGFIVLLALSLISGDKPDNPKVVDSPKDFEKPVNDAEIASKALNESDVPEEFSGYGEVSDGSSISEKTYTALYLESESNSGEVQLNRGYDGKRGRIEEYIARSDNISVAEIVAEGKAKGSYTQFDYSESEGRAWVGGEVNLSENQMTGGDTLVNMTLVMQKGKYVGWLEIRMRDYYTQDTQKVMRAALNRMDIGYERGQLRQALENYYPSGLSELR
jgi:hypothetical protein